MCEDGEVVVTKPSRLGSDVDARSFDMFPPFWGSNLFPYYLTVLVYYLKRNVGQNNYENKYPISSNPTSC